MLDKSLKDIAASDVTSVMEILRRYYQNRDKEVAVDIELYRQNFDLKVAPGTIPIKSGTTKSICDRAADRLGSGRIQTHMDARRPGAKEKARVEKMEQAASVLFYLARKRAKYNPIRALGLHGLNRGAMVAKFQLDLDALATQPDRANFNSDTAFMKAEKLWKYRQLERFPLLIDARPIESIYPDPETDGDNFVIEHYKRRVGDLKKNYPQFESWAMDNLFKKTSTGRKSRKNYDDDEMIEYTEIWTREWRGVIVEGDWVPIGKFPAGPIPNVYGRPPYFVRFAGFGDPTGTPEEKCVSVLRGVRDAALMESRMLTVVGKVAEDEAYGATVIDSDDESAISTLSFGPGAIVQSDLHKEGGGPKALQQQHNLPAVLQALQVAQRSTESGAVPNEAIGQASNSRTGTPSGVAAAILTGQASMIIDPIKGALEDLISEMIPFMFYVLDTVWDGKLALYGQVGQTSFVNFDLDSNLIDGHYGPVYVELKLQKPEDNHAAWNLGIQAASTGKFPDEFILERFFAVENAAEMVKDATAQRIAQSEPVMQYLTARLIERLQAKAQGTADKIPGQNVPAPGPIPPQMMGPGGPMPPSDGMAGPPMDPMMRATLGIPGGQAGPGGPMTAPVLQ